MRLWISCTSVMTMSARKATSLALVFTMMISTSTVSYFSHRASKNPILLWRQYHLMRRYQSWQFSLFRLEPLRRAIAQANTITGVVFQEIMFMNAMAVQGKLARLPNIMTLQTVEESFSRLRDIDPFYWFLHDPRSFFRHYVRYRNSLARFVCSNGATRAALAEVHHILDAVHAVWLRYNFNSGVLNLATQQLLDAKGLDLPHPRPAPPWRRKQFWDVAHSRPKRGRYLWRRSVLEAEPREEIRIFAMTSSALKNSLTSFSPDGYDAKFGLRAGRNLPPLSAGC